MQATLLRLGLFPPPASGAHILAGRASDLIAELGLAQRLEATYEEILATIHAHPTLSEAVMEASAQAFGKSVHI